MQKLQLKELAKEQIDQIAQITQQLHPKIPTATIKARLQQMFTINHYRCFGFYKGDQLIGLSSGWITVRIYSGKQLEIDNVIVDAPFQSQGYGKEFVKMLEDWSIAHDCETVELNAYIQNSRGHKFYHNQGYIILGFHYQKKIG